VAAVSCGRGVFGRRKTTIWFSGCAGDVGIEKVNCVLEIAWRFVWTDLPAAMQPNISGTDAGQQTRPD